MKTSEAINELATAMAKAQADMKPAIKDMTNPAFRSKYADLASVWDACRVPLTSNGLTVWQDLSTVESGVSVLTRLTHTSGQWAEFGPLIVPLGKHDAHGVGSASTYGKRFALCAAVGVVAEEDDDGNGAVAPKAKPQRDEARSVPRDAPKASGVVADPETGREVPPIDADAPSEREQILHRVKSMEDSLGLKPSGRLALWWQHVGDAKVFTAENAAIEKLQALEQALVTQCERAGK